MMRDMSSPMDASLSTRNQGQLVSTETVVTRPTRVGNLRPVPAVTKPITPLASEGQKVRPATGLGEITVPGLGTASWKWLGVAAVAGIVLWKLSSGKRKAASEATRKAGMKLLGG